MCVLLGAPLTQVLLIPILQMRKTRRREINNVPKVTGPGDGRAGAPGSSGEGKADLLLGTSSFALADAHLRLPSSATLEILHL